MAEPSGQRTLLQVLDASHAGDLEAAAELLPRLYVELRQLARSLLAKLPPGQTLEPTALVHEAYLRLVGDADPGWEGPRPLLRGGGAAGPG